MGKVCLDGLGDGFKTLHVGSVASPVGTITMSSAYRSVENLHVTSREKLVILYFLQQIRRSLSSLLNSVIGAGVPHVKQPP